MKPTQYSTIMPRIALENLKLIDLNELVCLIGKDLEEIFSFLVYTAYGKEVTITCGDKVEPGLLEEALFQNYAKTFNKLLNSSSKYIKNLLLSILHKFDVMNLKTMLRMVQVGIKTEDILQHIVPLGMYDRKKCQEMLSDVNSINDIVNSLHDQDFGFILKDKHKSKQKIDDLSQLEAALDKELYKRILTEIKNLDRRDKKIATNILGIEIDVLNVKIILKYKGLSINQENIKENLMPVALISEKILESAIKESDIKSTLQHILKSVKSKHYIYQTTFTKLIKESDLPISQLEFTLEKAPLEMSFFELKKNMRYYNIGYILAFLNMKWAEIKNLRSIINAVARNVSADQTHDLLILPENF
jgi:vacuolar-type H+-ATPase subunit C/Vma6